MTIRSLSYCLYIVIFILLGSCKSAKNNLTPLAPEARYDVHLQTELSRLSIPLKLEILELEKALNREMDAIFRTNDDIFGTNQRDFQLEVTKTEPLQLDVDTNQVTYRVPLNLLISKDFGIAEIHADGAVALEFQTRFGIQPDWTLKTETTLQDYQWLKKPKLKLGFVELPIESVANRLVDRSKAQITKIIDRQIQDNFVLKTYLDEAWKRLQQPIPASIENQLWIKMQPLSIGMTPLIKRANEVQATIIIETIAEAFVGERPVLDTIRPLPDFKNLSEVANDFNIHLFTAIPMDTAAQMVKAQVIGQSYSSGNKTVKIEDLEIYGREDQLVVNTVISGDYNGSIFLTGKPVYNEKKNRIEIDDLDYELSTRDFMQRSLGWLLKKNMKNRLEAALRFPLEENLAQIKSSLDKALKHYPITSGIILKGEMSELTFGHTFITPEFIRVDIRSGGKLQLILEDLAQLNTMQKKNSD